MEGSGEASELLATRRRKLEALREAGVDPFPHAYPGVTPIAEAKAPHEGLEPGDETEVRVRVAGRLAARRGQGKAAFLDLVDRSGRIQLHARKDVLGDEAFDRLLHHGLGDLETRLRRRELDLIANEESRELFLARSRIVAAIRRYLDDHGFVEV